MSKYPILEKSEIKDKPIGEQYPELFKRPEFEKIETLEINLPKPTGTITFTRWEKLQMIWYLLTEKDILIDIVYYILTLITGAKMKDPKTTITAIIMIIAVIAKFFGYDINQDVQNQASAIIMSIIGLIGSIGLIFAKDSQPK